MQFKPCETFARPCQWARLRTRSETVPRPFRDRLRIGVAAEVVCAQSRSPIHAQRQRFLHLAIPQLAESACESAVPATKSILEKAIYVLSWLYVKAIYLSCKPIGKLSIYQASYTSKLSICHVKAIYLSCKPIGKLSICQASYMSKLSICHASVLLAICQSYLFVMLATCHSYMSKQLAHLVPVLRKFLVKLPLNISEKLYIIMEFIKNNSILKINRKILNKLLILKN